MTKKNITFGSIIIGFLTLGLIGFSIYSGLVRLNVIEFNTPIMMTFIAIGAGVGSWMGFKYPILAEASSFALTSLIMVQATWDTIYDIQGGFADSRVAVLAFAFFLFILNMFTGKLKVGTAKKQIRRTLGIN